MGEAVEFLNRKGAKARRFSRRRRIKTHALAKLAPF
jgi:hypothetical protein